MNRKEQRAAERRARRAEGKPVRGAGVTVRSFQRGVDVNQMQPNQMGQPGQEEGFRVDPGRAFHKLQQRYAEETARTAGDLAAKDAAIDQLAEENQALRGQIDLMAAEIERLNQPVSPPDVVDVPQAPQVVPETNGHHNPADGPVPSIPSAENVPAPAMLLGPPPS